MIRSRPTAIAKLIRPDTRGVLHRERLFDAVRAGCEKKVIWISGPAGSGKTTLAASFLDAHHAPCLWYQLDEGDADPASFFYFMGLAVKNAFPNSRKPLPLLTQEYLLGIPVFAKRFFELIALRLMKASVSGTSAESRKPVIVFDNYQEIPEDSLFHAILNAGLAALPGEVNVFILSRFGPTSAFARLRAAGEMFFLDWEDIRLTEDETRAIALHESKKTIPDQAILQLHSITRGWVSGVILLLDSLWMEDFDFQLRQGLKRNEFYEYFASELFDRSSEEIRAFLLETSFLPKMTVRLAEALTGNTRAGHIFLELYRRNYFTFSYADDETAFQYHPLFQEFLQMKAEEILLPEHIQDLQRRAAKILEDGGWGEDAIGLLCKAGEWTEAIRGIITLAPNLIAQGRWQTLQGWILSMPEADWKHNPWLLFWMGVCLLHSSPAESRSAFERSFEIFKKTGDVIGSFYALSGMFDAVGHRLDSFVEFDRLIDMMNGLLREYPQFPTPEIEARVVHCMLFALTLRQPDNRSLNYWERCGFSLAREISDPVMALRILLGLIYKAMFSGDLEKVELILNSFQQRIETKHYTPLSILLLRIFQAYYYWLSIDFKKNRRAADDGIALAEHTGIHFFDAFLLGHGAAGALSSGEAERGEQYLKKMRSALRISPSIWAEGVYHCMMAWVFLLKGDPSKSAVYADQGLHYCSASGVPHSMAYSHLIKAMASHALWEDDTAIAHLSEIQRLCRTTNLFQTEFMMLLIHAQIAFDGGDESAGRDFLRKAMAIGSQRGYANGFFWMNEIIARLCVKAIESGIETEYVQNLIRKRNLVPDVPIQHVEDWPWSLKIYTLGPFEIVKDTEPVQFSGKVQQKPLLLLKALIAFGGSHITEDRLCDAIWPDADGDQAHHSLETALYRLRMLIGKNEAIRLKDGKLSLDRQLCWVDAFALEQVLNEADGLFESIRRCQADPLLPREAANKAIHLTHQAIDWFKGGFLASEPEQSWLIAPQKRLLTKYLRGVKSLACYWEMTGQLQMAVKCCHKAIEADALSEEFYQKLMNLYQQINQPAKAVEVYNLCLTTLKAELGVLPSSKTRAILKTIL